MDSAELRALQAPIKERYRADPKRGIVTLKAKGMLDDSNIAWGAGRPKVTSIWSWGVGSAVGFAQIRLRFDVDTERRRTRSNSFSS